MKNFSAVQNEDDLRISKVTLLLFLVPFFGRNYCLSNMGTFFGHPVGLCDGQPSPVSLMAPRYSLMTLIGALQKLLRL